MRFAKYTSHKNCNLLWIKSIPTHWVLRRIKDYTYVKGRIGWQGLRNSDFLTSGNYYCITGTDFKDGSIIWENCYFVTQSRYEQDPKIQVKLNDLLITKDGSIGKIAIITNLPSKATLNSGVFVTRPYKNIYSNKFMFWIFISNIFVNYIDLTKGGSTIQHLYQNVFERFIYPLPSSFEQTAIANYLDKKTALIDKKIYLLTQKADKYKELKQALINETVTRGLNKDVKLKDSGVECLSAVEEIGKIPEHWSIQRLKDSVKLFHGYGFSVQDFAIDESSKYLVKITELKNERVEINSNTIQLSETNNYEYYRINVGDILIALSGATAGKLAIFNLSEKCYLNQRVAKTVPNKKIFPKFLYYYLNRRYVIDKMYILSNVTAQPNFNNNILFINFIIPPYNEQIQIAEYLDKKTSQIDKIVESINSQIDKLKELRKTLINDVVTGKIKVTNDEAV